MSSQIRSDRLWPACLLADVVQFPCSGCKEETGSERASREPSSWALRQRLEILNGKRQSGKARKRRRQNDRDAQPRRAVGRARGRGASGGRGYAMHGTGRGRGSAHEDSDTVPWLHWKGYQSCCASLLPEELKPLRARGRGGSSVAMTKSHGQGRSATTTSKVPGLVFMGP